MSKENDATNTRSRTVLFPVRMVGWMSVILLCVALPILIALHSSSLKRRIIMEEIARLQRATHLKVTVSSYRWNLLSSIYLTGVKIESGDKPVLDCQNVRLDYSFSLQRPYLIVKNIELQKPFLQLESGTGGAWLLPFSMSSASSHAIGSHPLPSCTGFKFPRITILAGRIKAVQHGNTVLSIRDFSGAINLRMIAQAGEHKIEMELRKIHAAAPTRRCALWDLGQTSELAETKLLAQKIELPHGYRCRGLLRAVQE